MASHSSSRISVVIPVLNEAPYLRPTIERLQATLPAASEIVVVDEGSTDGSADLVAGAGGAVRLLRTHQLGSAAARNYGAAHSSGEIIVFADAHVEPPPGWWQPMLAAIADPCVGAVGPALAVMGRPESRGFGMRLCGPRIHTEWLRRQGQTPYPVPVLCACFLAMRRDTFETTGGFDSQLIRWGSNDMEVSLRLWLMGYDLLVVPQVTVAHLFRKQHPYQVRWVGVLHNMLRLAFLHFSPERITRIIEALKGHRDFAAALALCVDGDVWAERSQLSERRVRDDDWYFNHFGMAW